MSTPQTDIDSIELGDDFAEVITTAVGSCDVLLVLIGDRWLTVTGQDGRRRLDNPDDFVRLEIEAALARDVRVIPILVEGARMPRADELPASLSKLARRQALELSPSRFHVDTGRLLRVLERAITEAQEQARKQAEEAAARQRRQVEQLPASAAPPSASAVPANIPRHDTNGQASPVSSEPPGLQPANEALTRRGERPRGTVDAGAAAWTAKARTSTVSSASATIPRTPGSPGTIPVAWPASSTGTSW